MIVQRPHQSDGRPQFIYASICYLFSRALTQVNDACWKEKDDWRSALRNLPGWRLQERAACSAPFGEGAP